MKMNAKYLLMLPLLALSLVACNGNGESSSSIEVVTQTDWTDDEKILIGSAMGRQNAIPFHKMFIENEEMYFVSDYYSVGKVSIECLLAEKTVDSDGVVFYDPLNDVDRYKDFCLDNEYSLDEELSDDSVHSYVLTQTSDTGSNDILETLFLEIYLSESNYLTVDGWNVTNYQTEVWPSRVNLDTAEQGALPSIAEILGLEENQIPSYVSHDQSVSMDVAYRFKMDNGNLTAEMEIATLENVLLLYSADLVAAEFLLDSANSTAEYENYYNSESKIDVFLNRTPINNVHKIKFVVY